MSSKILYLLPLVLFATDASCYNKNATQMLADAMGDKGLSDKERTNKVHNALVNDANPNTLAYNTVPVLTEAVNLNSFAIVKMLVEHGADVNGQAAGHGNNWTALDSAFWKQNEQIANYLINHEAEIKNTGRLRTLAQGNSKLLKLLE